MGDWLESIWISLVGFFDWIIWFLSGGIFDFFTSAFDYSIGIFKIAWLGVMTWSIEAMTSLIVSSFSDITLANDVENAWSMLPIEVVQAAVFFNIPQSIAIITGAYLTSFIIRRIPGG